MVRFNQKGSDHRKGDLGDTDVTDFSMGSSIRGSYQHHYCVIGQVHSVI